MWMWNGILILHCHSRLLAELLPASRQKEISLSTAEHACARTVAKGEKAGLYHFGHRVLRHSLLAAVYRRRTSIEQITPKPTFQNAALSRCRNPMALTWDIPIGVRSL